MLLPYIEPSKINYLQYIETNKIKMFKKNELIPRLDNMIIYLKSGQIRCTTQNINGEERLLSFIEPNNMLTLLSMHDNLSTIFLFIAQNNCEVIYVPVGELFKKLGNNEVYTILTELTNKVSMYNELLLDISSYPIKYRVYKFIFEASKKYGKENENGILILKKIKTADMASILGSHRVNVSKIINSLINKNIIMKTSGHFLVKDIDYIESYLNKFYN